MSKFLIFLLAMAASARADLIYNLSFNQLPSSVGWTYIGISAGKLRESIPSPLRPLETIVAGCPPM